MELNKETIHKIKGLIVFTAVVIMCFWKYDVVIQVFRFVFNIIYPFVLGGAIAFVLNVPMSFVERHLFYRKERTDAEIYENKSENKSENKNEEIKGNSCPEKTGRQRKMARFISLLIVIAVVMGIVVFIMFVLIPQLADTFSNLGKSIQDFIPTIQQCADRWFHNNKEIMEWINGLKFDWNKIVNAGIGFLRNGAGNVVESTINTAKSIISALSTFFIALSFSIYVLVQKEKLGIQAKKVLFAFVRKGRAEAVLEVISLTYRTFSSFLTGQCFEAIILGTMFAVTMAILRLPYALLIGILIAFTALIPIFGAFIGCAVGAFLIFMVNPLQALIFVILFLILQQIEGNLIYPHVVGNSVGLPSIWVLAAVSIGGSLMGIKGMLIFIPVVSVMYALFREIVYLKLKQRNINPDDIN